MADVQGKRVAASLKQACEEAAAQAIRATTESGQASHVHHKNRKFGSRKEAMDAKVRSRVVANTLSTRLMTLCMTVFRLQRPSSSARPSSQQSEYIM